MQIHEAFKKTTGIEIEEGIKKAIEGGYKNAYNPKFHHYEISTFLLDSSFWIALGKSLEWTTRTEFLVPRPEWRCRWHDFVDALAE